MEGGLSFLRVFSLKSASSVKDGLPCSWPFSLGFLYMRSSFRWLVYASCRIAFELVHAGLLAHPP